MTLVPPSAIVVGSYKNWFAARKTVPPSNLFVNSVTDYNVMRVMSREMPNLQQITVSGLGDGHKWSDGEDSDEETAVEFANWTTHDIDIMSNFSKLRVLEIEHTRTSLNGRYPFLFNSYPLLQTLIIENCDFLKWDLEMLAGMPLLKELYCGVSSLTGNVSSLRVLKDTLEKVEISVCPRVEGNFMDLADFPHLKELKLSYTAITGDIRDISENHFLSLEVLDLPKGVYGGSGYELQRISDAPDLLRAVYLIKKQRPALVLEYWHVELSKDSPDWYASLDEDDFPDSPPFYVTLKEAGSRIGYRWRTKYYNPCEVNWLDPEPDSESSEYEEYIGGVQAQVGMYRGFHQPPTQEEYTTLFEEHRQGN
jgi:hypothetical protein